MKIRLFAIILSLLGAQNMAFSQTSTTIFSYKFGKFEISLLSEGQQLGNNSILIGATAEMVKECVPNGNFPNAVNAFLIRTSDKIILIDAGFGRNLFANMQLLGVASEQVDIVLLTHMHGDHIGGMLQNNKPAFPNATVYLAQPEHDYWMKDEAKNLNAQKVIAAYTERLHLFTPAEIGSETTPLFAGLCAFAAFGHTPGHVVYEAESNGNKLLVWGDLTHAMAIQMPYPQVAATYDSDPKAATASRKKILEYVAKNKIPIAGMHIAFPSMGAITRNSAEGYIFTPFQK